MLDGIWVGGMVLGVKVYIRGLVRVEDRSCVLMRNMNSNFGVCRFVDIRDFSMLGCAVSMTSRLDRYQFGFISLVDFHIASLMSVRNASARS